MVCKDRRELHLGAKMRKLYDYEAEKNEKGSDGAHSRSVNSRIKTINRQGRQNTSDTEIPAGTSTGRQRF